MVFLFPPRKPPPWMYITRGVGLSEGVSHIRMGGFGFVALPGLLFGPPPGVEGLPLLTAQGTVFVGIGLRKLLQPFGQGLAGVVLTRDGGMRAQDTREK